MVCSTTSNTFIVSQRDRIGSHTVSIGESEKAKITPDTEKSRFDPTYP